MTNGIGRRKTARHRNVVNSDVTVQLRHPRWKTRLKPYCKTVCEAIDAALSAEKIKRAEITVVLADDALIRQLNHEFRGKNKPTNILSFPGGDHLGDLVLALETIEREAVEQGKTVKNHTKHLLVHGTLHLLGFDHEREKDAKKMEALEVKILKKLGIANPYL